MKTLLILATLIAAGMAASATDTNEPTVVTSDHLEVDYARNLGTFTGNVIAIDPRITVRADKMVAFYGIVTNAATNAPKSQSPR